MPPRPLPDATESTWRDLLYREVVDHGLLRHAWTNLAEIAPGIWRSNHPSRRRLARYRDMGIVTILSLRGGPRQAENRLERADCAALGLDYVSVPLSARSAPRRESLLALFEAFRQVRRPFLLHCKSGADRAGLAAALYLLAQGQSLDQARAQLSPRFLHLRWTRTGILDALLDAYAVQSASDPIGIEDWVREHYDPKAIAQGFRPLLRA